MRSITIATMLLGAALAAPAPAPAPQSNAKALDRRWSSIMVTDIDLKSSNGRLESASVKVTWGPTEIWCFHKGLKHGCNDIDNKPKDDFDFHMEDQDLPAHGYRPKFWVSRRLWHSDQEEVASVDMGIVKCGRNQVRLPCR